MKRNSNTTTKKNKNGGNKYAITALKGIGNVVGNVAGEYAKDLAQNVVRNKHTPGVGLVHSFVSGPSNSQSKYNGKIHSITPSKGGRRRKSKRIRTRVRKTRKR
jgi:hypothetical protein